MLCLINTLNATTLKIYRAMAKTLKVYILYGDKKTLSTVISRMAEHDFSINYSGEYLYSSSPWDWFIEEYCQDIKADLRPCVENWADSCLLSGYDGTESDSEVSIYNGGEEHPVCKVYTYPCYIEKFTELLGKLCRIASFQGTNIQFDILPKKF